MPSLPRSLPRICVALGAHSAAELGRAAERECKDGSTFVEFRLDYLPDAVSGIEVIRRVREKNPDLMVLATCRHARHHGGFTGTVHEQLSVLERAGRAGAIAVDIEIESAECAKDSVAKLRKGIPVIVSYHDFEKTPALAPVLRRLQRLPAEAYKIATTISKPADSLRLFEFIRAKHEQPMIAVGMSECGVPTRILSPSFGSLFTYAAPADGTGTAPGQVPAQTLRTLYRADKLTSKTRVFGIIADPVAHSKSPLMHNRGFQARRIDAVYLPFRIGSGQLADFMKLAAGLPLAGFSVTIPHKQKIMRYLDAIDPLARRIGAVNTVWRRAGKWRGANTDAKGVLIPLSKHLRLANSSVLIAGYGGAARAAAIALNDAGARITITGRDIESAQKLASAVRGDTMTLREAEKSHFDALVHATPLGMAPKPNESIFRDNVPAGVVMDMVYNPHETLLLKQAAHKGRTIVHGIEMLLEQAVCQFELWTGQTAPRAVMLAALEQKL